MLWLYGCGVALAVYVLVKLAYQEGRADGEESGFDNGIKFAEMRAQLWREYENGKAD
jgi:hypothetical protein